MQTRTSFRTTRITSAIVAIVAVAASASSFAASDPSRSDTIAQNEAALAVSSTYRAANGGGPLTREQVREELRQARTNGTLSMHGEAGDTAQVLAAREVFNVAQRETIVAEVVADQQRVIALAEAETRRAAIEAEAQALAQAQASGTDAAQMPEGGAAATTDETEVRVDVIDMQTSATSPDTERVIVSLDGGDAAAQQARAMHVRRQVAAIGLPQDRVYVEGSNAEATAEMAADADGDVEVAAINGDDSPTTTAAAVDGN